MKSVRSSSAPTDKGRYGVLKAGFSIGIQIWIVFLVVLFLLQYPAPFSIVFGAIAGFAGGVVAGYFRTPNQTPAQVPGPGLANTPLKQAQQRLQQWRIGGGDRSDSPQPGWFRQRRRKTLRSRRKSSDSKP